VPTFKPLELRCGKRARGNRERCNVTR